jgi:hypothetical protein
MQTEDNQEKPPTFYPISTRAGLHYTLFNTLFAEASSNSHSNNNSSTKTEDTSKASPTPAFLDKGETWDQGCVLVLKQSKKRREAGLPPITQLVCHAREDSEVNCVFLIKTGRIENLGKIKLIHAQQTVKQYLSTNNFSASMSHVLCRFLC